MHDTDSALDRIPDLEPVRLLEPDGTEVPDPSPPSPLGADQRRELYRTMALTRRLDREFVALQRQGQLALYSPCEGQEAAQVGTAAALEPGDWVFPQYRELGVFVHRGIDLARAAAFWRGTALGHHDVLATRTGEITIPIATHTLHAVGYAMGVVLDHDDTVVVTYLGDGATSEGDAHEAFNLAAVWQAPCVFVVQNNQYAISVPAHRQTNAPSFAHKAVAYGMPGRRCDGNDVLACHAVMAEAVERARRGGGPTLVEAVTYRMGPHTTSDDPTRYRSDAEVEHWRSLDPIDRLGRHLRRTGLWDDGWAAETDRLGDEVAAELRSRVAAAEPPDPLALLDTVYVEPTPALQRQRAELAAELGRGPRPEPWRPDDAPTTW